MPTVLPPPVASLERRLGVPEGGLSGPDLARAEDALEDATALALAEVTESKGELWRLTAPAVVALVILKAARREYENPRGLNQETYGDHSVGVSETSGVYLTHGEVVQLRRAATGRPSTAYSVATTSAYRGAGPDAPVLTPVAGGSSPIVLFDPEDMP